MWGVEGFGYWISLSALAQFFSMCDLGVSIALANQLCLKQDRSAGDALRLIRSAILDFVRNGVISIIFILIISLLISVYYLREENSEKAYFLSITFVALAFSAAMQPAQAIYCAAWRFIGKNEIGIFILNTVRLLDFGILIVVAFSDGGMLVAATAVAVLKFLLILIFYYHLPSLVLNNKNNLSFNEKIIIHKELSEVKQAGHGFTLISMSQQMTLHGPVLLITAILGPVFAAVFAACRTISRLPVQPLTVLLASLNPEITDLIAREKYQQLRVIVRRVLLGVVVLSIFVGIGSLVFIDVVERFWLGGKLNLNINVLTPLCLAATFYLVGQVINQALSAANETKAQSKEFAVVSIALLGLMVPALLMTKDVMWSAIIVLLAECAMTILLLRRYSMSVVASKD